MKKPNLLQKLFNKKYCKKYKKFEIEKNNIIKKEYQELDNYIENIQNGNWNEEYKRVEKLRSECPYCGSKNIIYDFKNVNGEINGETKGKFGLFGGSVYGWVEGEIDTDKVYYCKKCDKAWKDEKYNYRDYGGALEHILFNFYCYFDELDEIVDFDKNNPEEKFKTQKEKQKDYDLSLNERYFKPFSVLRNYHPETIKWLIENKRWELNYDFYRKIVNWDNDKFYIWGCKQ